MEGKAITATNPNIMVPDKRIVNSSGIPFQKPAPKFYIQSGDKKIEIAAAEAKYLSRFEDKSMHAFELSWMRYCFVKKPKGIDKIRLRKCFAQGWNACAFMGADYYIHLEKKKEVEGNDSNESGKEELTHSDG